MKEVKCKSVSLKLEYDEESIISPQEGWGPDQHNFHCICHRQDGAFGKEQRASASAPAVSPTGPGECWDDR